MNLRDFILKPCKDFTLVDSNDIDVDWVYSPEFEENINNVDKIYFRYDDLDIDIFDNEGLMSIFGLSRSRNIIDINNLCIVINYTNKNDDSKINELYENLNLWKVPFFISPADNFNQEDYVKYLSSFVENLLSNKNSVIINPVYSFVQYIFSNILLEDFTTNIKNIDNIKNPTPPTDVYELFVKKVGEDRGNEIKNEVLSVISNEDKEKLHEVITAYLNNLKENIIAQKDNLGLTLINDNIKGS